MLNQNLAFLRLINEDLSNEIESSSHEVTISSSGDLLFNNQIALASLAPSLSASFQKDLSNPSRIRVPQIINNAQPLQMHDLASDLIDSHEAKILANLPNLCAGSLSSEVGFQKISKDLVIMGSLAIASICNLLAEVRRGSISILSITLVESDVRQLCALLHLIDFKSFIEECKSLRIKFHLIYDSKKLVIQEELYRYITSSLPASFHGLQVIASPLRLPILEELRAWLFAQSGLGFRFLGTLGSSTDELNQLAASAVNLSNPCKARWLYPPEAGPASLDQVALVVGSGPSLDEHLPWISAHSSSVTIFAAGSSLGSLLRYGIQPDVVVFLERGSSVYDDLQELIQEGHQLSTIKLIASITTDPRLSRVFQETYYFHRPASSSFLLSPENKNACLLHAGPESNNAAVDAVLHVGFSRLVLIGCDFAASNRDHRRSRGALGHTPRELNEPVLGNKGRTVFSEPSLLVARDALDASLSFFPKVHVLRLGEGAQIKNAINVTGDEILSQGWLSKSKLWSPIESQCPAIASSSDSICSTLQLARSNLDLYSKPLIDQLTAAPCRHWTSDSHQIFGCLFAQDALSDSRPAEAMVRRLYRETLFHAIHAVYRAPKDDQHWTSLIGELSSAIEYCNKLYDYFLLFLATCLEEGDSLQWDAFTMSKKISEFCIDLEIS